MNHLIVDFTTDRVYLSDKFLMDEFLQGTCNMLGMEALSPPLIHDVYGFNPGLSGILMITTSHITMHTFTAQEKAYVDVFSCKPFTEDGVLGLISRIFNPATLSHYELDRAPITLLGG